MRIGERDFDTRNKTYVMGILNVTPDSFSDGGKYNQVEQAVRHAEKLIRDGADIIDIGGESTRPGHTQISEEEEIQRVAPVIEKLRKNYDVPLSIDTYKSKVAGAAIEAGAQLVNDIWGLRYDKEMAATVAAADVACCIMHNREKSEYQYFLNGVMDDLTKSIHIAKEAGIGEDKIILDPGVGFGKTYEMNLAILKNLSAFHRFPYPILLGASRKSVIGLTLDLPVDQREEGTLVTTVMAVMSGCTFVRVHDVAGNRRAILMAEAIQKEHGLA
ncbi:MAG: dihydropteroate synthase [Lachnospiraceae bacterium]